MRPNKPTYRIYIDEVGNSSPNFTERPDTRFFSLTGVIVELGNEANIAEDINKLKLRYFGSTDVILHRNDIENARAIFGKLSDPQLRQNFTSELVTLLNSWPYTIITVCADKLSLIQSGRLTTNIYYQCFKAMLEGYVFLLNEVNSYGDIMLEGRGRSEDIVMQREFTRIWSRGQKGNSVQQRITSKHLKIRPKAANEAGLQLADVLAYPSYRELLQVRGLLAADTGIPVMTQQIMTSVPSRYYRSGGDIKGRVFLE